VQCYCQKIHILAASRYPKFEEFRHKSCGSKVNCWKEEGLCSLLAFVKPFAVMAFALSCCSIVGALVIISSWGFIGLRTESRKFFIILSSVNLITSLISLPILSTILIPSFSQWLRTASHVLQVLMILNQYFAACSFLWTTIINIHLYSFVKYGREALKWNKSFHLLVWILAVPSTIPIIVGISSNIHFPMFVPYTDIHVVVVAEGYASTVVPSITANKFVDELKKITLPLQLLTFGALLLWSANILSTILIKVALNKFFKHHYLDDTHLKKELGIDTSLTTVSQLLILAQTPGLVFAGWLYFSTAQWQNPVIIQISFTLGASFHGLLNSIYYVAKRDVRLRFWILIKNLICIHINKHAESRRLISIVQ